ncbi:TatD family hydrolase [Paenibacillus athensensis]|nr:TatD family hydrolase [Paenibacillus athensensis]
MPAIDAHIHLDLYNEADIAGILERLPQTGVEAVIAVSLHLTSCRTTQAWKHRYPGRVVAAYGYHPEQAVPAEAELNELLAWMTANAAEAAAIGEIGLPYYSRKEAESKNEPFELAPYVELLDKQLQLAKELNKPVVLHAVYEDAALVCDLLEQRGVSKAHFHWFKGPLETVRRMIAAGYFISITPDVHNEPEIRELVRIYPLELMMVETDGPWAYEGAYARPLTEPAMVLGAIEQIAAIKELSVEAAAEALYANTKRFYAL